MNRREIIAELRRSAMEDEYPMFDVHTHAWLAADRGYWRNGEIVREGGGTQYRTWLLFVAHALEDEA